MERELWGVFENIAGTCRGDRGDALKHCYEPQIRKRGLSRAGESTEKWRYISRMHVSEPRMHNVDISEGAKFGTTLGLLLAPLGAPWGPPWWPKWSP